MKLYQINNEIERILDGTDERTLNEDGEPDSEKIKELVKQLNEEIDIKLENLAVYVKNKVSDENQIDVEIANLQKRKAKIRKHKENAQASLQELLTTYGKKKIESSRVEAKVFSRKQLEYNEAEIPQGWYREKIERVVDKQSIKEAVNLGEIIPGVTEIVKQYITIK